LIGHTIDMANYNAHGHAQRQAGTRRSRDAAVGRREAEGRVCAAGVPRDRRRGVRSEPGGGGPDYQTTSTGNFTQIVVSLGDLDDDNFEETLKSGQNDGQALLLEGETTDKKKLN
jgi:hypothetical protein